jgi:2-polyprenyl-3-methyl-5-hydroxy-6-metoxy-1,4-benzoquinol methylase
LGLTVVDINTMIWDELYQSGNFLHYPSEVFVQLFFRTFGKTTHGGTFLDHGCGSGNNSEFIARQGWQVTGSDVSIKALEVQKKRLNLLGTKNAQILIDSNNTLGSQIDTYDNILCWDCLCYNPLAKAKADAADLFNALKPGGYFFANMPTLNHEFATTGVQLDDGSIRNGRVGTKQEGAIMAIPSSLEDFIGWFPQMAIIERGHFIFDFAGYREFMFIVGQKPLLQ